MGLIWLIVDAAGIFAAIVVLGLWAEGRRQKQMQEAIATLPNFSAPSKYIDAGAETGIASDDATGKFCFLSRGNDGIATTIVEARNIVRAEIVQDGTSRTVRSGGGGGFIMLGHFGVPVGGQSAHVTSERVTVVQLRVVIDNPATPVRTVSFLASDAERGGSMHRYALDLAQSWLARIDVLLARQRSAGNRMPVKIFSVADELEKLANLKATGLLSEREFERQRSKLLA